MAQRLVQGSGRAQRPRAFYGIVAPPRREHLSACHGALGCELAALPFPAFSGGWQTEAEPLRQSSQLIRRVPG
jgi:hypothetical protein